MNKVLEIGAELLIAMYIIAVGEWDGVCFVYYPKLPTCFTENVLIKWCGYENRGDLLSLRVNENMEVEFWFIDENEEHYSYSWKSLLMVKPMLCVMALTHIYDMIENMEDC